VSAEVRDRVRSQRGGRRSWDAADDCARTRTKSATVCESADVRSGAYVLDVVVVVVGDEGGGDCGARGPPS
jgi:hypothetical protein